MTVLPKCQDRDMLPVHVACSSEACTCAQKLTLSTLLHVCSPSTCAPYSQVWQHPDLMHGQQAQASRAASAGPGSLQRRLLNARLRLSGGQGILLQTVGPTSLPLSQAGGCTAVSIAYARAQVQPAPSPIMGMLLRGHLCRLDVTNILVLNCWLHEQGAQGRLSMFKTEFDATWACRWRPARCQWLLCAWSRPSSRASWRRCLTTPPSR